MKSRFTRFAMLFAMGALSLGLLAACSSDDDADTGTTTEATPAATEAAGDAVATTINAGLSEFAISVSSATAPAGDVTFVAENTGALPHELVIVRSDAAPDSLPLDGAVLDKSGLDIVGEIEEFAAGTTESGTFTLEAGNYILLCDIAGHYQGGMFTAFTVE
jgi:uncharacterized cupredoxin-like copper-binding protein